MARRSTISQVGFAQPSSRKLKWRCEQAAGIASSDCEKPRRFRHQVRRKGKAGGVFTSTWQVVDQWPWRRNSVQTWQPRQHRRARWFDV